MTEANWGRSKWFYRNARNKTCSETKGQIVGSFPCPHYLPLGLRGCPRPSRGGKKKTKNVFPSLASLPFHSHPRKPAWTLPLSPVILQGKFISRVKCQSYCFCLSILGQTQSCTRFSVPSRARLCCLFWFVYTQCIQFASLFFLSVHVKHLNKVSTQNFTMFRYSS